MKKIGIEKINLYGCSLYMNQYDLALARGRDPERVLKSYLIESRSLNPPYEDTVTMAANAAKPVLTDQDKRDIGLLIVGTEGGVDFGKPISTNLHRALGLPPRVRNYETKHACYSAVAALDTALNWIAAGLNRGKKALVIATDFSRKHFRKDHEFVLGGVAAAVLVSDSPRIISYELEKKGFWTTDVYDTFRPSAFDELGNNQISLYSYMDALEGSYLHYVENVGDVDFDTYFKKNVYHMPFPGMSFQAHRLLCNLAKPRKKSEVVASFNEKNRPALRYSQKVGSTYSGSNFVGLCGVIMASDDLHPGDRIGFFSYGSGAIGEFYSGIVCEEARKIIENMALDDHLDARRKVTVEEYEQIENLRETYIENPNFVSDLSLLDNWFDSYYKGKGLLYLKEVKDFRRVYDWS
ncbi:MAG: hydroxymethylglutaryl-CoA synthase family protein [Candidatus Aminicenantes bacterium]|nr:hydroxymethylglutaryl-CoA synthase family protein [Candidatus Aminicenantes bacterium]